MKSIAFILLIALGSYFLYKVLPVHASAEVKQEIAHQPLSISGTVPTWLSGTLVRNGPIKVTANGESTAHWFDGLAMLHAFSFENGKVHYTNRFLRSDAYHTVFDEGSIHYPGFAADPCRSLFKKFFTYFFPNPGPSIKNANVNVAKIANQYVALTETPLPVQFDPGTLETLGVLEYQDALPKERCWESAHPHHDNKENSTLNYLIKYGRESYYTLYHVTEGSPERKIIAEVPVQEPAYMHSFATTENFIILTEFPFVVSPRDLLAKNKAFIKNFQWKPERGTQFIVIDKQNGQVIGKYATKPFFAFHHANAFENKDSIIIDVVTYNDASIITGDTLLLDTEKDTDHSSQLERFTLQNGKITSEVLFPHAVEFPRINDLHDGKAYRYLYLAGFDDPSNEQGSKTLYKIDTNSQAVLKWSAKEGLVGEPVFVSAPKAQKEDEGVLLSLVLEPKSNHSYLVILDGQSFEEVARAEAPHLIPGGLHGQYFTND